MQSSTASILKRVRPGEDGSAGTATSDDDTAVTEDSAASELPRTGMDALQVGLIGVALMTLAALGLRRRATA